MFVKWRRFTVLSPSKPSFSTTTPSLQLITFKVLHMLNAKFPFKKTFFDAHQRLSTVTQKDVPP